MEISAFKKTKVVENAAPRRTTGLQRLVNRRV